MIINYKVFSDLNLDLKEEILYNKLNKFEKYKIYAIEMKNYNDNGMSMQKIAKLYNINTTLVFKILKTL
jgi:Mor family transcriptional regulator